MLCSLLNPQYDTQSIAYLKQQIVTLHLQINCALFEDPIARLICVYGISIIPDWIWKSSLVKGVLKSGLALNSPPSWFDFCVVNALELQLFHPLPRPPPAHLWNIIYMIWLTAYSGCFLTTVLQVHNNHIYQRQNSLYIFIRHWNWWMTQFRLVSSSWHLQRLHPSLFQLSRSASKMI